jgi:DNA-binding NarL/FixJ family response regulator
MAITLLLADDHRMVRQGLRAVLDSVPDFRLVGEAADGLEAVRLVEKLQPDVLVLDMMMPGLNGLEVTRRVARRPSRTRIVILSMHSDIAYVVAAIRAGAQGYILKEQSAEELIQAIHTIVAGRRYLSPPISEAAVTAYLRKAEDTPLDPYDPLTSREREVLHLTAEGLSGAEIAGRLFISPRTVETHRANLMRKLGVRNQKELIRLAVLRGLQPAEPISGLGTKNKAPRL